MLFWFDFGGLYFAAFRIKLNCDQEEIVKFAAEGQNFLITGQSVVGKSEVVKRILRLISAANVRGKSICSFVRVVSLAKYTIEEWHRQCTLSTDLCQRNYHGFK